ncbi:hypothetical protein EJ419_03485 [Alloscardovia theropitheci]|uniref:Uncharacterized protein n=1 Tax=Alloscardovia theropitheci TaxID=2496842 RepID=A0A4R0QQ80_9BIFI|nr:hypothetical protein [Alloscardovia theropitheci]TCD54443.1 hypothetical protein EJ419_03485 [Alloscardovia theropitheci]
MKRKSFSAIAFAIFAILATTLALPISNASASTSVPSNFTNSRSSITGTIDLSSHAINSGTVETTNGHTYYNGVVSGSVEASDLFEGAYNKYVKDFQGKSGYRNKHFENIVMFGKNKTFPTASYTVTFPSYFSVNEAAISVAENTSTISNISHEYNPTTNSVTFTFNLGNWNDYKGFFELYKSERGASGHPISISIPYTVDITDISSSQIGQITAKGSCELYKYGRLFFSSKIVNISIVTNPITVTR